MGLAHEYMPAVKYGAKWLESEILGLFSNMFANSWYVDGDNGSDNNTGKEPGKAFATIQKAVTSANHWDTIYIKALNMVAGATDPESYAETIIIPAGKSGLRLIGIGNGRVQGGLPQIKIGAGSTAMLTVRSPGCVIANLGLNGASSTGGGILLDDDGSTKSAFGTEIVNCHFKNCKCHATDGTLGGAIYWSSSGGAWQVRIADCTFYKNLASIVVVGTGGSVPQDVVVENCTFSSSVKTDIDVDIYVGGSGVDGLVIRDCDFATVDVPTKASGSVQRYISLATGTEGIIAGCRFACIANESATEITFGASGSGGVIPTTVRMSECHGETGTDGTMESGEIFRT